MGRLEEMFGDGWYKVLQPHLESPSFRNVGMALKDMAKKKVEITPRFPDTFKAFKECPWEKLNTILLGQDPYPGRVDEKTYVADGLAFSSKNSKKIPKSLNHIFEAIETDIYGGYYDKAENFDLRRWANQGVLLINCALSFPLGNKSAVHIPLWSTFIKYVLERVNERKDSIAIGLFGNHAKACRPIFTNKSFGVYSCEHPAAVEHRSGSKKWNHENIFKSIDSFHKFKNNITIDW